MYRPVDPKASFPLMEEKLLAFWEKNDIFQKSVSQRDGNEEFVFYDGPPFATGLPHYGHFVPSTVKDVIPRYHAMKGRKVERRFGWDCHGLPVEYEMEKELGISGKRQIEAYGVAKFNEACRSIVLRYTREWRKVITRLGRWVDFDHDYKTMDPDYMETIWWVVSELWKKGLLYEGFYILPYCPRCSTALSNFELNLGGYLDVADPAVTVKFALDGEPGTSFLAWTTTPWTLPSNLGLALGPEVRYVKVRESAKDGRPGKNAESYILAEDRLPAYYKDPAGYEIIERYTGKELAGKTYTPLFPFFADLKAKGAFRVLNGDFVSTDEGTGIVHIAPGFGEDDYNVMKGSGLPVVCPVDEEGKFTAEVPPWAGLFVKDADKSIIAALKERHAVLRHDSHTHSYPHCWRCKSPLIYRAISEWFVSVEKIKTRMLAANDDIFWMPPHLKSGRFGKWLENARDWAISRSRYWGNPIPIWRCESCGAMECLGSRAELEKKTGSHPEDLHKHFIDPLTYACSCGGTMRRIPDVLDCWFESGAMPYGQNHYPFENRAHFDSNFPANFISESIDQTRGWFYTLVVLGAALFDKPTFRNVIVSGLILDSDGKKMSKSARNYTDPMEVIGAYGADAMRLFLLDSAVLKAEDLRFSEAGVKDVVKNVIIPLWNSYSFFVTYANIDGFTADGTPRAPANPLDRWILSEAERMVLEVTGFLDGYDLQKAADGFMGFIDLLNNWYIRRSRRRFWRSGNDSDKQEAYQALHAALLKLILTAAPFIPFITEEIYSNLKTAGMPESIHLCDYPVYDESRRDPGLERRMKVTMKTVSMGRSLRTDYALKIRQPLKALHLVTRDPEERRILAEMEELIKDELNVKSLVFRENEDELVEYRAKANFRTLGKQLGKDMKAAAARIESLSLSEIHALLAGTSVELSAGERAFTLTPDGVEIQRIEKENLKVINDGSLTVALDPELTPALVEEGLVRDLVRGIQKLRKEKGLEVTDRIELSLAGSDAVRAAAENHREHLLSETLASSWKWDTAADATEIDCGDETCAVSLRKVRA